MINDLDSIVADLDESVAPVMRHFSDITEIPRPSGNEAAIRAHLVEWAASNRFEYDVDKAGNIIVSVPATPGFEDAPRVILQSHMDMVTFDDNVSSPTQAHVVQIDGEDWLTSQGDTTLGADNGIGMAMSMAYAEDPNLKHGPLTILITVDEEVGMTGAQNLDHDLIPEDVAVLLNLDSEEDAHFVCKGSAGGADVNAEFDISDKEDLPEGFGVFTISLSGLEGGHSGVDINKKTGNAIRILNTLLISLRDDLGLDFMMMDYRGGQRRNVIPSDASCTLGVNISDADTLRKLHDYVASFLANQKQGTSELTAKNAEGLNISLEAGDTEDLRAINNEVRDQILAAINEVTGMEMELDSLGHVLTSNNLGILGADESGNILKISNMPRAAESATRDRRAQDIADIYSKHGAWSEVGSVYDGWEEPMDSPAVKNAAQAVRDALGVEPALMNYHAGLECVEIKDGLAEDPKTNHGVIPCVSMGPRILGAHTIKERVKLSSIAQVNLVVRRFLELYTS